MSPGQGHLEGHRDRGTGSQGAPALLPGQGRAGFCFSRGAAALPCSGTAGMGFVQSPKSPHSWIPAAGSLCAQHTALQSFQSCSREPGPALKGWDMSPSMSRLSLSLRGHGDTQDSRGEVAPARSEQLMVPKPSHGDTAEEQENIATGGQGQAPPGSQDCQNRSCGWEEPWWALVPAGPAFPAPPRPSPCPGDVLATPGAHP